MAISSTSFASGDGRERKPKGAVTKITQASRELFLKTIEGQISHIEEAFAEVKEKNPVKYLELLEKYLQYFIPKKVDLTTDDASMNSIPIINWANSSEVIETKPLEETNDNAE